MNTLTNSEDPADMPHSLTVYFALGIGIYRTIQSLFNAYPVNTL